MITLLLPFLLFTLSAFTYARDSQLISAHPKAEQTFQELERAYQHLLVQCTQDRSPKECFTHGELNQIKQKITAHKEAVARAPISYKKESAKKIQALKDAYMAQKEAFFSQPAPFEQTNVSVTRTPSEHSVTAQIVHRSKPKQIIINVLIGSAVGCIIGATVGACYTLYKRYKRNKQIEKSASAQHTSTAVSTQAVTSTNH